MEGPALAQVERWLEWAAAAPDGVAYGALALAALLENLLPPLPGDIAVVFGGYLAGRGRLGFAEVLIATTAGSWCGFMSYFLLGRWLGRTGVHQRIGALLGAARLEQGEAWVRRHGYGVVLANRLLPGLRSVVGVVAGFSGLAPGRVALLALVSAAIWDVALVVAGYYIGEDWQRVQRILTTYNRSVLAVLVVVIAFWAWRRWGRPRRMRQSPNESDR